MRYPYASLACTLSLDAEFCNRNMFATLMNLGHQRSPCYEFACPYMSSCICPHVQVVLWFAGLRGAVAFAAATVFPDENGNAGKVLTTTMGIVIAFTFVAAPLTMPLIKLLKMRMNVQHTLARCVRAYICQYIAWTLGL